MGDLRARLGMGTTQTTIFQDGFTIFMGSSVDVDKFFVRFLEKMPKKHGLCFGQICQDMFGISSSPRAVPTGSHNEKPIQFT